MEMMTDNALIFSKNNVNCSLSPIDPELYKDAFDIPVSYSLYRIDLDRLPKSQSFTSYLFNEVDKNKIILLCISAPFGFNPLQKDVARKFNFRELDEITMIRWPIM